ncbi:phytanoyl-CoA dioxygenase family protein [Paludibacterium yongneupense]|uniref:phytanoyl-CoA dioxygenase family protein n=1 Tax=Paludibacterium yongneupense TaxID=400061 RepID=UPI00041EB1BA|nr:phytanoyl-CoA dioxygenase family protein [Paludibacterium yongneupense]
MHDIYRFSATAPLHAITAALEHDGCVVVTDLLTPTLLGTLREELAVHLSGTATCHGNFYGFATRRLSGLISKSQTCRQLAIHPLITAVMDTFLLLSCREYQLNLTQAICIGPGEPQQYIHTDAAMFPFENRSGESMINCMIAIDDFTSENGATRVVPGSHRWPPTREANADEILDATMPAGSMLIYFGSLQHGGGANRSAGERTGLVLSYSLGWLRQAENQYLAVPLELAAQLPVRLQRLLGYFVHAPNLGCYEGQDPIALLDGSLGREFREFLPQEVEPQLAEFRAQALSGRHAR